MLCNGRAEAIEDAYLIMLAASSIKKGRTKPAL